MPQQTQSVLNLVARTKQLPLPDHTLSTEHALLRAMRERAGRPKLRDAKTLKDSGVVACEKIRELIFDLTCLDEYFTDDNEFCYGWIAHAARELSLPYATAWGIAQGEIRSISTHTVNRVSRKTGVPYEVFYALEG